MSDASVSLAEIQAAIRNVPDFPEPGIQFKDITPVIGNARLFTGVIDHICSRHATSKIDHVAGIDARGFIFGAPAARQLGAGFVPIRKKGKLPWQTSRRTTASNTEPTPSRFMKTPLNRARRFFSLTICWRRRDSGAARNLIAKTKASWLKLFL